MANDWWANKLGTPQPAQPQVPLAPVPQQYTPQTPAYPPQPVQPAQYPPSQQIQTTPRCPGCGSGNYAGGEGSRARCYDCGYPIQQSGSGVGKGIVGGPQATGPVQPARQAAKGSGFNPQTIIGHI